HNLQRSCSQAARKLVTPLGNWFHGADRRRRDRRDHAATVHADAGAGELDRAWHTLGLPGDEDGDAVMEARTVGRSGLRVSRIGLATHTWGSHTDADDAAGQLSAFVDAGGTLVDTSPAYTGGAAQAILADLLGDVVPREELVLAGCAGVHPSTAAPTGDLPALPRTWIDTSRRELLRQLDHTLRELGTDHLDIWQVAAWDARTPIEEITDTLAHAVRAGKARYAGVRG